MEQGAPRHLEDELGYHEQAFYNPDWKTMKELIRGQQASMDEHHITDANAIWGLVKRLNDELDQRELLGSTIEITGKVRPLYRNQDIAVLFPDNDVKTDEYGEYCQVFGRTFICGPIDTSPVEPGVVPKIGVSLMCPYDESAEDDVEEDVIEYAADAFIMVDADNLQHCTFTTETIAAAEQWIRYYHREVYDNLALTIPEGLTELPQIVAAVKSFSVYQKDPELIDKRLGNVIAHRLRLDYEPYTVAVNGMLGSIDENGEWIETPFVGDVKQAQFNHIIMQQSGDFSYRPTLIFAVPTHRRGDDDYVFEARTVPAESLVALTPLRPLKSAFGRRAMATFSRMDDVKECIGLAGHVPTSEVDGDADPTLFGDVHEAVGDDELYPET